MTNEEFDKKWFAAFAGDLTEEQKRKAHIRSGEQDGMYGYLWHAFSYEFVPCLKEDEAKKEYNKANKDGAFELRHYTFSGDDPRPLSDEHMTAEQIEEKDLIEFFVIGKDHSRCYIRTHECYCGPYFCYASKGNTESRV
jgi:hypothetical protein